MEAGTNFGLNNTLRYYEFELDSYDTDSTPGSGVLPSDWPLFSLARPLQNLAAIKVLEVTIPFSWYVFNYNNNTFTLNEGAGGGDVTVTIPEGNYNGTSLATALELAMNAVSPNTYTYIVSYNPVTGKLIWEATTPGGAFTLKCGYQNYPLGNYDPSVLLGLRASQSSIGNTLVGPDVAMITGPSYLYLNSRALGGMCNLFLPYGAENLGTLGSQIAKIPINCQPFGLINWQDPDPQKWFDIDDMFSVPAIDFYFTLGNTTTITPLEFNGLPFSIKLGMLVNSLDHDNVQAGTFEQNRVVKRARRA